MAEHSYVIRQQDRDTAVAFIDSQISKDPRWFSNVESQRMVAEREYRDIKADPPSFNEWCRKWMNETQWAQIKEAISLAREQKETLKRVRPDKTISLTHRAWEILSDLARQDDATLSEVIVNRLGRDWVTVYVRTESRYTNAPNNRQHALDKKRYVTNG